MRLLLSRYCVNAVAIIAKKGKPYKGFVNLREPH